MTVYLDERDYELLEVWAQVNRDRPSRLAHDIIHDAIDGQKKELERIEAALEKVYKTPLATRSHF